MAALVLFVCFTFIVFQAGYQWRKASAESDGHDKQAVRISLLGKL